MKTSWYLKYFILMSSLLSLTIAFNNCSNDATFDLSEGVESLETFNDPNTTDVSKIPTIIINDNSDYTRESDVNLSLIPNRRADHMLISNQPNCLIGTWETFKDNKSWTLASKNQQVAVFVKYRYQDEPESECVKDEITHDDTPPVVTFNQNINNWISETNLNIIYSVSDSGSGVKLIECDKDGSGQFQVCGKSIFYNSMIENKSYVFRVRSTDNAGNTSVPKQVNWQSDQTPPVVAFNITPSVMTSDQTPRFVFVGSDLGSGVASYDCKIDQAINFSPCLNDITLSSLQDGNHQLAVRATDNVGRVSQPLTFQWLQDSTAPTVEFTQTPTSVSNSNSATFAFAGINAAQGIVSYECKTDSGSYRLCSSPITIANLADGTHQFSVIGSDSVGNKSAPITYSWLIDTMKPTIQFTQTPNSIINTNSAQFRFQAQDVGSGIKEIQCRLDSAVFAPCLSPHVLSNVSSGSHQLQARSVDNAGNFSNIITFNWIIDNTAPTILITGKPLNPTKLSVADFSFVASDGAGSGIDKIECRIDGGNYSTCTSPTQYANLTDGQHNFFVRAYDRAGNISAPQSVQWLIDLMPPNLNFILTPNPIVYIGVAASLRFLADDGLGSGNITYQCQYLGSPISCTSDVTYSYVMANLSNYTFMVTATDAVGNSVSKQVQWDSVFQSVPKELNIKINQDRPVDILFVVDISGSMDSERSNLAQRVNGFLNIIKDLDWQIAVTSTDVVGNRDFEEGRLTNFAKTGDPKLHILNSSMDRAETQLLFGNRVQGMPNGDGNERGILATVKVIQRALDGTGENAINRQFIRTGADLAVIVLSDEDENSDGLNVAYKPQEFLNFVSTSFNNQKNITWHSIVTRSGDVACKKAGYSYYGVNYETLSQLTGYGKPGGAIIGSVCDSDYTSQLKDIGQSVKDMQKTVSLSCAPFDSDDDGIIEMSMQFKPIGATNYSNFLVPFSIQSQKIIFDDYLPVGDFKFNFNCTK